MTRFDPGQLTETIAAVSTPPGRGALGIIRLCGPDTLAVLQRIFQPRGERNHLTSHRMCFGALVDPRTGQTIDQVMVAYFAAPHSYTGEDMGEISHHGSPVLAAEILNLVLQDRARLAWPGEFTLRAFLNGKMDLSQAEAVRDLIDSRTSYQARIAEKQLEGSVSRTIRPLKDRLIGIISHLETAVEFAEDLPDTEPTARLTVEMESVATSLAALEENFRLGHLLRRGVNLVITGRPNVGKSSLFNRLLGEDRAIVTEISGTTRDVLREPAQLFGIPLILMDTAGIRPSEDVVEKLGVERSYTAAGQADIILHVMDATLGLLPDELSLVHSLPQDNLIVVLNKQDLPPRISAADISRMVPDHEVIPVSALTGEGLDALRKAIHERLIPPSFRPEMENSLITNIRQQQCLRNAHVELRLSLDAAGEGVSEEYILYHLCRAVRALDELTGRTTVDDILERIFSTFCIGK
ncbi:MAG: tRNA uridine-5-carboxymethylaminomethyl(34) synthesis GTPase MnmE [Acidobacteria bacterium]|nr:tRNA uridine-5-carboxymethylaminomethyl(34) synthesis GTPase MnmE [Acidobacteriota bacterium]